MDKRSSSVMDRLAETSATAFRTNFSNATPTPMRKIAEPSSSMQGSPRPER